MESGILMIVIVVIGVFYPVYTAWISLVAAPVISMKQCARPVPLHTR